MDGIRSIKFMRKKLILMSGKEKCTKLLKPKVDLEEHEMLNGQLRDQEVRVVSILNRRMLLELRFKDAPFSGEKLGHKWLPNLNMDQRRKKLLPRTDI